MKNVRIYARAFSPDEVAQISGIELPHNLAGGCRVTASKSDTAYSLTPEKLTDGDTSSRDSRWSSGATRDDAEVTIDLGSPRKVDGVKLYWENAYPGKYSIALSLDNRSFQQVTQAKGRASVLEHKFSAREARYVKISMSSPATQWGYSLYEVEVFGK
jgi:hexosaminidase